MTEPLNHHTVSTIYQTKERARSTTTTLGPYRGRFFHRRGRG